MDSTASPTSPASLAPTLPPEILNMILCRRRPNSMDCTWWPGAPPIRRDLHNWMLVCRSWRDCIQARIIVAPKALVSLAMSASESVVCRESAKSLSNSLLPGRPRPGPSTLKWAIHASALRGHIEAVKCQYSYLEPDGPKDVLPGILLHAVRCNNDAMIRLVIALAISAFDNLQFLDQFSLVMLEDAMEKEKMEIVETLLKYKLVDEADLDDCRRKWQLCVWDQWQWYFLNDDEPGNHPSNHEDASPMLKLLLKTLVKPLAPQREYRSEQLKRLREGRMILA